MSNSVDTSTPIETRDQLIADLASGVKPKDQWRIGTEHEKFPFYRDGISPVPYEGECGIGMLLDELLEGDGNYEGIFEGDVIIGLKQPSTCGKFSANISLEPGGQFELSGAPLKTIHQTRNEIGRHFDDVTAISDEMGIGFLGLGYSPKFSVDEIPHMPKGRYGIMREYMPKVGQYGLNMMHNSCTVQVNLDFGSEEDMVKKFRVSLALQPLATALFGNSVFKEGKLNGFHSFRSEVWRDVDADRTGMLPFVFEEGMDFGRYVDYALEVPMYFVYRNGEYINVLGQPFSKFMEGKLEGFEGQLPTMDDWEAHLTTIFPEVRLKQFLEMRGADCGPAPFLPALSAFWTGLLYDGSSLDAAYDLVKVWSAAERQALRDGVPQHGLKTPIRSYAVADVAKDVLAMADEGLKARGFKNPEGQDERIYLEPLHEIIDDGWSLSDRLIDLFKNEWNEDADQVYEALQY